MEVIIIIDDETMLTNLLHINKNHPRYPMFEHTIKTIYYRGPKTLQSRRSLSQVLKHIIKNQEDKELLLEQVLRLKNGIGGLIENKIRSFLYYGINDKKRTIKI
jgi:hypothetical protein